MFSGPYLYISGIRTHVFLKSTLLYLRYNTHRTKMHPFEMYILTSFNKSLHTHTHVNTNTIKRQNISMTHVPSCCFVADAHTCGPRLSLVYFLFL